MASILVVDDDRNICRVLKELLEKAGFRVLTAYDGETGLDLLQRHDLDALLTDLRMPKKSGMELLVLSRTLKPSIPVILMTAYGDIQTAVAAMKKGAYDFITKPVNEEELLNIVEKAVSEREMDRELVSDYFETEAPSLPQVIGKTPAIQQLLQTVRKVAPTDSTVLITGETGVGKELIARAIHFASPRKEHPFVKVNCFAIPEALLESELFGYEKGAFTGAMTNKPGRFELARKGTILLDEIGEVPFHLQAKLLTVIQDKSFERLGGVKTIKVDTRILAATNVNLLDAVRSGKFRADLFYRLNVVSLHVPPLRERRDDLPFLINYFLKKYASKYRKPCKGPSPEAMDALLRYDWPGNIRELENVIERMVVLSDEETLSFESLPPEMKGLEPKPIPSAPDMKSRIDGISRASEKQMIQEALARTKQNRTRAAKLLGISRRTIQKKIREYGLQIPWPGPSGIR